ncbi:hypothetical protein GCM10007421_25980 [Halopseudomonas oceani]|uniref:Uncharacterized protein n=1 Tax=Halopseudomonas oceani TaxID=1708783 RepID=A0A2P4EU91_9GAMM|nr:hypothetical protein C1949_11600 [Halopseudomonas oceani]GGE50471.1 hypothetical protein GCM10007421_25980 [Halopseudomonas oceani]
MAEYKAVSEFLFWVSMIMLLPGLYYFVRAAIRYVFFRFVSNEKVVITVRRGGKVVQSVEVDSTGYVVDQIRKRFEAGEV